MLGDKTLFDKKVSSNFVAAITLQERNPTHSYRADGYLDQRNAEQLRERAIASKKEFLKEIIKEVCVSDKA